MLRTVAAANASALTLDGTRTYLVGARRVAVIDPGPAIDAHLDALARAVLDGGDDVRVRILLTHSHPDHAEAAPLLARRLGTSVIAAEPPADRARIETDAGDLVALATPGHTPDHFAFHWPAAGAVFVGDLMTGGLDTALVAAPEGDLSLYLASLERVRALEPHVLYPSHGPPFLDAAEAIERYVRHRAERERQVLDAVADGARTPDEIVTKVYGSSLPDGLRSAAAAAVVAYLEHLERTGRYSRTT